MDADVEALARAYYDPKMTTDRLYAALRPSEDRFKVLAADDQLHFRGKAADYVRLYAFLSQIVKFADVDLEKLYQFIRHLRRLIPAPPGELPREIQQNIDMDSYRVQFTGKAPITLDRVSQPLEPIGPRDVYGAQPPEIEPLSQIIRELNERFGTDFTEEDKVFIQALENQLGANEALKSAVRVSPPENARLAFDQVVEKQLQEMVDQNFKFYKRVTDDRPFSEFFLDWLFGRFAQAARK